MATTRERFTKDGKRYYEIRYRIGRGHPELCTRWYVPDGWSKKVVERELSKQAADFERKVRTGEIVSAADRKAAKALEEAEQAKIQTFKQYTMRVYLPALEVTASDHTMDNFKRQLKNHIYPAIGEMKLTDITKVEISALLLSAQKKLKVSSAVKLYCILSLIFKMAYTDDVIDRNPMDKVHRPKAKKEEVKQDETESYTFDDLARIIVCLDKEPLQWNCYTRLLIDTGCRRGEACALKWSNIDFENNTVTFEHSLTYIPGQAVKDDTPKNGKVRTVDVDPDVMALLRKLKDSKIVSIEQGKKAADGYVFTQSNKYSDAPIHPDSPTRYFKKFGDRYGFDHFHPHKLRHTQASLSITNGADVVSVSKKLGHSDPSVTMRVYSHGSAESIKRAGNIFRTGLKKAGEIDKAAEN